MPLEINPEMTLGPGTCDVITSPSNMPHVQEEQRENTANGLSNSNYILPDWNLGVSLPINSKLASPINMSESETTVDDGDDGVDAMGVISHFPAPNCGLKRRPSNYFGPSSTMGLLDKARTAMNKGRTSFSNTSTTPFSQEAEDRFTSQDISAQSYGSKNDGGVFGMVIPSRPDADDLIESYWRWMHSLYPFIHRPSFEERYLTIWYPQVQ